jgi:hypothetical protein
MHVGHTTMRRFLSFPVVLVLDLSFVWGCRSAYDQLGCYQRYTSMYILQCNEHPSGFQVAMSYDLVFSSNCNDVS